MNEPEGEPDWERLAKDLLRNEFQRTRLDVTKTFHETEDAIRADELTPADVQALRNQLNDARTFVEEQLAPVVGCEPWADPCLPIPAGAIWDTYGVKPEHAREQESE